MKTLDELYNEITNGGEELRTEAAKAAEEDKLAEFAAKYGVETTDGEFRAFLDEKLGDMEEMSEDELESAAGGIYRAGQSYQTLSGVYRPQSYSTLLLGGSKSSGKTTSSSSSGKRYI